MLPTRVQWLLPFVCMHAKKGFSSCLKRRGGTNWAQIWSNQFVHIELLVLGTPQLLKLEKLSEKFQGGVFQIQNKSLQIFLHFVRTFWFQILVMNLVILGYN